MPHRDNVRAPVQFRRKDILASYKMIFLHEQIHTFLNQQCQSYTMFKLNKLNFFSIKINKPLSGPVHGVSQLRFKLRSQLYIVDAINHTPDHTIESSVKRGNFGILGNFRFFNTLPLLALLCACGAYHSFLLYAIRKRLKKNENEDEGK